jgi:predicted nuclease of restriction endonuclease-like (RecB) superfamily
LNHQPSLFPQEYDAFFNRLKDRIQSARIKAAWSVNRELITLYWRIGSDILERQTQGKWGAKVITRLSQDIKREFPSTKGFSPRNLGYMKSFAQAYPDLDVVQEVLAQMPWYQNCALLDKLSSYDERLWYAHMTIEHGWSRNILIAQIDTNLYSRQGKAITNFKDTLPKDESEATQQVLKSEYNLEFLQLEHNYKERDLEQALISHMRTFLLELGTGFAFVGNQHRLDVAGDDFFIDLLFYHIKLKRYVVIEIKTTEFRPEYSGKLNFYINVVNDQLRDETDNPTVGIILCSDKNQAVVEYALSGMSQPMGVTTYRLQENLPEDIQQAFPSPETLMQELKAAAAEVEETP